MGIRADKRIGIRFDAIARRYRANDARQILQIHLMADARSRRHRFEILKRGLSPTQERVTLHVALKFEFGVQCERIAGAEIVHLHRVVDDQFHGKERIDALWIAADFVDGLAHRGEIDDRGNTSEILQKHARGHERNFFVFGARRPRGEGFDVIGAHKPPVFASQKIFQKYAQGKGKLGNCAHALRFQNFQPLNIEGLRANV